MCGSPGKYLFVFLVSKNVFVLVYILDVFSFNFACAVTNMFMKTEVTKGNQ